MKTIKVTNAQKKEFDKLAKSLKLSESKTFQRMLNMFLFPYLTTINYKHENQIPNSLQAQMSQKFFNEATSHELIDKYEDAPKCGTFTEISLDNNLKLNEMHTNALKEKLRQAKNRKIALEQLTEQSEGLGLYNQNSSITHLVYPNPVNTSSPNHVIKIPKPPLLTRLIGKLLGFK